MKLKNVILVKSGIASLKKERNLTPRILFYHGVAPTKNSFVEELHISPERFKQHLAYLKKHYEPISIDELYERWSSNNLTGKEVCLTLDDGYKNNLTIAAPILREFDIPFTVFISTYHVDTGERFATFIGRAVIIQPEVSHLHIPEIELDCRLSSISQRKKIFKTISRHLKHTDIHLVKQITTRLTSHLSESAWHRLCNTYQADAPMSWEEVANLQKNYDCTIGSHCLDHFICDTFQEETEIYRQITESKNIIEEKLKIPCHYLAYPNGNSCPTALKAAEKAGYKMAFTTAYQQINQQSSPFAMPRYGVDFDINNFKADLAFRPR